MSFKFLFVELFFANKSNEPPKFWYHPLLSSKKMIIDKFQGGQPMGDISPPTQMAYSTASTLPRDQPLYVEPLRRTDTDPLPDPPKQPLTTMPIISSNKRPATLPAGVHSFESTEVKVTHHFQEKDRCTKYCNKFKRFLKVVNHELVSFCAEH